jgi:hypothetical protein
MNTARRLRFVALGALIVSALAPAGWPAGAFADSVGVTMSADPVVGVPMTITTSGTSASGEALWVFVQPSSTACATRVYDEIEFTGGQAVAITSDQSLPSGAFSEETDFTPSAAAAYTVCAYVSPPNSGSYPPSRPIRPDRTPSRREHRPVQSLLRPRPRLPRSYR